VINQLKLSYHPFVYPTKPPETDLYKMFQTSELTQVDDKNVGNMPNLLALRKALYSDEFRSFVAKITGVSDLTDRVDCAVNAHTTGCHLLCHDDVIGTRRVSYIIYLTDPDSEWTAKDGGALEIYPLDKTSTVDNGEDKGGIQGVPEPIPAVTILPKFNTAAFFAVQPGRSYHSVQEIFSDKPRLSIQGWYHGPDAVKGSDLASLNQIMKTGDDKSPFVPIAYADASSSSSSSSSSSNGCVLKQFLPENDTAEITLTSEELAELGKYINATYLKDVAIEKINDKFCSDSSVQLKNFLREDLAEEILSAAKKSDEVDRLGNGQPSLDYTAGISEEGGSKWAIVGPTHKRRHLVYSNTGTSTGKGANGKAHGKSHAHPAHEVGKRLDEVRQSLFHSPVFAKYLKKLTALRTLGYRGDVRRFRPGLDYTVAYYGAMTEIPRLDATLCFVNEERAPEVAEEEGEGEVKTGGEGKGKTKKKVEKEWEKPGSADAEEAEEEEEDEEDDDDVDSVDGGPWESGDIGGFECYIEADDTNEGAQHEAAESYRAGTEDDEETTLLSVTPGTNVLSLVMRDQGIMRFVKYVSAQAPSSRWDVSMEYEIVQPEKDDDEEEDEDGDEDDEDEEVEEEE
jgi:prolyl 3-hydroxylase /prolyl 3,4-dihydroxylase